MTGLSLPPAPERSNPQPRYWLLGSWTLTGIISVGGTLYSLFVRSQITASDSDQQRELVAQSLGWLSMAGLVSIFGVLWILISGGLLFRAQLKAGEGATTWRLLKLGILLLHLSPWIWLLLRVYRVG